MKLLALCVASYLIGSFPTGILLARRRGIDLKNVGSGNVGATNVLRSAGKGAALLTLAGDTLKGAAAVALGSYLLPGKVLEQGLLGVASVVGHDFSVFSKFRGGKGVATSIGVLLVFSPRAGLATVILWAMTVAGTRYSSLGALVAFGVLPGTVMLLGETEKLPVAITLTLLLFLRHRENLVRLFAGRERKIGERA